MPAQICEQVCRCEEAAGRQERTLCKANLKLLQNLDRDQIYLWSAPEVCQTFLKDLLEEASQIRVSAGDLLQEQARERSLLLRRDYRVLDVRLARIYRLTKYFLQCFSTTLQGCCCINAWGTDEVLGSVIHKSEHW